MHARSVPIGRILQVSLVIFAMLFGAGNLMLLLDLTVTIINSLSGLVIYLVLSCYSYA
jgi:branched-subunit amino acid permease